MRMLRAIVGDAHRQAGGAHMLNDKAVAHRTGHTRACAPLSFLPALNVYPDSGPNVVNSRPCSEQSRCGKHAFVMTRHYCTRPPENLLACQALTMT
eukprot:5307018-Alexandrium_andersonii.AAC.1